jgi:biopolymer transport protein ExbD
MEIPSPRSTHKARIEIIPLIDIIFFLLATFVMVSLSMVKNKGIPVNLPVADQGTPQERKDHVAITVTADGKIFFDQERLTLEQLPGRLEGLRARAKEPAVVLNGDAQALLGQAVAVLDEVRKAGISKVAIETRAKP